jgi:hypothetical protein
MESKLLKCWLTVPLISLVTQIPHRLLKTSAEAVRELEVYEEDLFARIRDVLAIID